MLSPQKAVVYHLNIEENVSLSILDTFMHRTLAASQNVAACNTKSFSKRRVKVVPGACRKHGLPIAPAPGIRNNRIRRRIRRHACASKTLHSCLAHNAQLQKTFPDTVSHVDETPVESQAVLVLQ